MRFTAIPRRGPDREASEPIESANSAGSPSEGPVRPETPPSPSSRALLTSPVAWIASAGGFGYAPVASGTFGSAAAVLLFWALSGLSLPLYLLTVVALGALGVWASDRGETLFGNKDDGRIVIDEVAGQLVTLVPVLALAGSRVAPEIGVARGEPAWWALAVTAFVVFRVFDIWKPGPVRWAERSFPGGVGVMADDILAGAFGAIVMAIACYGLLLYRLGS